jgi:ribonucleoside-triphosphate reductase (formate)
VLPLPKYVIKRDGSKAIFEESKVALAIWKAVSAVGGTDRARAESIASEVVVNLNEKFGVDGVVSVEEVQDVVETSLIKGGHDKTAKAYILYRHQRELLRKTEDMVNNFELVNQYVSQEDWRVRENSNMAYSLQGMNFNIAGRVVSNYWLGRVYPEEIALAHKGSDIHIHDLDCLAAYCVGWDLKQLLLEGFTGVRGKVASKPAKHLRSALGQVVNFFYTLQGEAAGAQAFSSFDTYLAPFIRYDNLNRGQVKQAIQEFIFNTAVPTRVGFQTPFTNITMDLKVPSHIANDPVIIGGKPMELTYADFQEEMDLLNDVFCEVMTEGDASGRIFTFPIPTYNITPDFEWDNPKYDGIWEMTAKYGIPYFSNYVNSDMKPEDARSMCLDGAEEIIVKINGQIVRTTLSELIGSFGGEGWSENKHNIQALSLREDFSLEWSNVKNFLKTRLTGLRQIKTEDGKIFKASFNHPVSVLTINGVEEKFAKDLSIGDYLLSLKSADNCLNENYQQIGGFIFNEELAFFLGYFTADGNYLKKSKSSLFRGMQFTFNANTLENLNKIKSITKKLFDYDLKEKKDPRYNSYYAYIYKSELASLFHCAGFQKYGRVSNLLFNSPKHVIKSFLEGFFAGDGYDKRLEIHINDSILARDLVLLYNLIGVSVSFRQKENSQVIYLHHKKNSSNINGLTVNCLSEWVPGFVAKSTYLVPGLNKGRMVGLATLQKYSAQTEFSEKISSGAFYPVRVSEIIEFNNTQDFYDVEIEKNHRFVHSLGTITHNCCRLRLDNRMLNKRGGGLFGANPLTGSIGVVTINMPRLGFLSKSEGEFFERLGKLMDLAKESLIIKRKTIEQLTNQGLYPYSKFYLRGIKEQTGGYWTNHFSTIGLLGMNEALLNFLGKDITTKEGLAFSVKVLDFMRDKLQVYQNETGDIFNLEATPGEGTSRRFAWADKKIYPNIIVANEKQFKEHKVAPYYTNSTQLPVGKSLELFDALDLQDPLQTKYTGGTVFHVFLGERIASKDATKNLVRKISANYKMPYFSITPTFSICPIHGYISGEHEYCPICEREG